MVVGRNSKPRRVTFEFVHSTDHWVDNDKKPCDANSLLAPSSAIIASGCADFGPLRFMVTMAGKLAYAPSCNANSTALASFCIINQSSGVIPSSPRILRSIP